MHVCNCSDWQNVRCSNFFFFFLIADLQVIDIRYQTKGLCFCYRYLDTKKGFFVDVGWFDRYQHTKQRGFCLFVPSTSQRQRNDLFVKLKYFDFGHTWHRLYHAHSITICPSQRPKSFHPYIHKQQQQHVFIPAQWMAT